MWKLLRRLSISTKLTWLALSAATLALVVACAAFVLVDARATTDALVEYYSTMADVCGQNCLASLDFADADDARHVLSALAKDREVEEARLFDAQERLFAVYQAGQAAEAAPETAPESAPEELIVPNQEGHAFDSEGHLHVIRQVRRGAERLGVLHLQISLDRLAERRSNFAITTAMVFAACWALSALLAWRLQSLISRPVVDLVETVKRISNQRDYSIRVVKQTDDELGALYDAFNGMVEQIQARDAELDQHRLHLEELVALRTRALEEKTREALAASVAKSQFLANMSHEIRTPMNAILGFTDLLRRGADGGDEADRKDYLDTIHGSGQHLLSLINDILDLSKIEAGRIQVEMLEESPHQIIAEAVSVMRVPALNKGLTLDYNWCGPIPRRIRTDPSRLRQLLINLIGNAVKFTHQGGVQITAQVEGGANDARLRIEVIDTGIGIAAEKLRLIFDPFTQADTSVTRRYGGTGLGLAISRHIAEAMGGALDVKSQPGQGSVFTITLAIGPIDQSALLHALPSADVIRLEQPVHEPAQLRLAPAKVLVVEDGETNRKLIRLMLRRQGLEVAEAENGQAGVDAALADNFDLIFMDMQMPVKDGYSATRELRALGVETTIVALTAHAMKGDEEKCRQAGCTDYLTKPIDEERLLAMLARHLPTLEAPARDAALASAGGPGTWETPAAAPTPAAPAAASSAGAEPPLYSSLPMDDQDFREIVAEFLERLRQKVEQMRVAVRRGEHDQVAKLAHWLKGSAGTAGFETFTAPAARLERAAKAGDLAEMTAAVERVASLTDRAAVPDLAGAVAVATA